MSKRAAPKAGSRTRRRRSKKNDKQMICDRCGYPIVSWSSDAGICAGPMFCWGPSS